MSGIPTCDKRTLLSWDFKWSQERPHGDKHFSIFGEIRSELWRMGDLTVSPEEFGLARVPWEAPEPLATKARDDGLHPDEASLQGGQQGVV